MTNASGTVVERYAYDAYGAPTITDGSGTTRTTSAESNRYLYTGREYDEALDLYHYLARMYGNGRFLSHEPIGYADGSNLYGNYFSLGGMDPSGQMTCEEFNTNVRPSLGPDDFPESIHGALNHLPDVSSNDTCGGFSGGSSTPGPSGCDICLTNADRSKTECICWRTT